MTIDWNSMINMLNLTNKIRETGKLLSTKKYECEHTLLLDVEDIKSMRQEFMFHCRLFNFTNSCIRITLKMQVLINLALIALNSSSPRVKYHIQEEYLYLESCRIFLKGKTMLD